MSSGRESRPLDEIADEIVKLEAQLRLLRQEHQVAYDEGKRSRTEAQKAADESADKELRERDAKVRAGEIPADEARGPVPAPVE